MMEVGGKKGSRNTARSCLTIFFILFLLIFLTCIDFVRGEFDDDRKAILKIYSNPPNIPNLDFSIIDELTQSKLSYINRISGGLEYNLERGRRYCISPTINITYGERLWRFIRWSYIKTSNSLIEEKDNSLCIVPQEDLVIYANYGTYIPLRVRGGRLFYENGTQVNESGIQENNYRLYWVPINSSLFLSPDFIERTEFLIINKRFSGWLENRTGGIVLDRIIYHFNATKPLSFVSLYTENLSPYALMYFGLTLIGLSTVGVVSILQRLQQGKAFENIRNSFGEILEKYREGQISLNQQILQLQDISKNTTRSLNELSRIESSHEELILRLSEEINKFGSKIDYLSNSLKDVAERIINFDVALKMNIEEFRDSLKSLKDSITAHSDTIDRIIIRKYEELRYNFDKIIHEAKVAAEKLEYNLEERKSDLDLTPILFLRSRAKIMLDQAVELAKENNFEDAIQLASSALALIKTATDELNNREILIRLGALRRGGYVSDERVI